MKTFAQKSFEKLVMLERNKKLGVAVATLNGEPCLCAGIGEITDDDTWSFTPLARLLTWHEINQMEPDEEKTGKLQKLLNTVRDDLVGTDPDDFVEDVEHPLLTESALTKIGL